MCFFKEVLPALSKSGSQDIGIIAPYNEQVNMLKNRIEADNSIDVATVYKFRAEKKTTS